MPKSRNWSPTSAPCHLEWRPSRLLAAALLMLGLLAAVAVLAAEVPSVVAWPGAVAVVGYGHRLARRELRRPSRSLAIPAGADAVLVDGAPAGDFAVCWRGPLAFVHWRDARGRRERIQFWPDTWSAALRRELRLAMIGRAAARAAGSMAP